MSILLKKYMSSTSVTYRYWGFQKNPCYNEADIFRDVLLWGGTVQPAHPYYEFTIPQSAVILLQLKYPDIVRNGFFID